MTPTPFQLSLLHSSERGFQIKCAPHVTNLVKYQRALVSLKIKMIENKPGR